MRQTATWFAVGLVLIVSMLAGACRGDESESPPMPTTTTATTAAPTSTPIATATATPSLEEEVSAAYLAYWDAYAEAVLELDPALVEEFATGDELQSIRDEIEQLRRDGVAARVVVDHDLVVANVSARFATVVDRVNNRSFYVDPETKQPETTDAPGEVVQYTFALEQTEGRWVVSRGLREPIP